MTATDSRVDALVASADDVARPAATARADRAHPRLGIRGGEGEEERGGDGRRGRVVCGADATGTLRRARSFARTTNTIGAA